MTYWAWDSSLETGIETIDNQHRQIIGYINDLYTAHKGGNTDQITKVLMGLLNYTATHFTFEEKLLEKIGYPLTDSHKKIHANFISDVDDYVERHVNGEDICIPLLADLKLWLDNHIRVDDAEYTPYADKFLQENSKF